MSLIAIFHYVTLGIVVALSAFNVASTPGLHDSFHTVGEWHRQQVLFKEGPLDSKGLAERLISQAQDNRFSNFEQNALYLQKASEIYASLGDNLGLAIVSNLLSDAYFAQYKPNKGFWHARRALEKAREVGSTDEMMQAYLGIARYYKMNGEYDKALKEVSKSIASCESMADCLEAYTLKAFCLSKSGNRVEALRTYLRIKNASIAQNGGSLDEARVNHHIAYLLQTSNLFHESLKYYEEVLAYYKTSGNTAYLSTLHTNMGCVFMELNQFNKARAHFIKAHNFGLEAGKENEVSFQYNMANLFLKDQQMDKAANHFDKIAEHLDQGPRNHKDGALFKLGYSRFLMETGLLENAEIMASESLKYLKSANLLEELEENYDVLSIISMRKGLQNRSNAFLAKRDSISNILHGPHQIFQLTQELVRYSNTKKDQNQFVHLGLNPLSIWEKPIYWFFVLVFLFITVAAAPNHKDNGMGTSPQPRKISKSELSKEEVAHLVPKLEFLMTEKKCYQNQNISILSLARELKTTNKKLSILLNSHLGVSFYDYINKFRVDDIKTRLKKGEDLLSIDGIAKDCGFKSRSSFYRTFKQEVGCTPSEFKKRAGL